jgi:hypothetical protein
MERAGFVDIVEVEYKWPMNGWSQDKKMKNIGRWNQLRLHDGIEGFMLRYRTHAYLPGTVVYGRKSLQ